jgi:hypothetical protein
MFIPMQNLLLLAFLTSAPGALVSMTLVFIIHLRKGKEIT